MILSTLTNVWHTLEAYGPLLIVGLLVWWFVRAVPETRESDEEDGGGGQMVVGPAQHPHRPRPGGRRPRGPRRGPHGGRPVTAPMRVRTLRLRSRVAASS